MIINTSSLSNWFRQTLGPIWPKKEPGSVDNVLQNRPSLTHLSQKPDLLPQFVAECQVAQKYLGLLGPPDWDNFPQRATNRSWPGPQPVSRVPFVAAYLVKLDQQKIYMSDLRAYLVEHPALVWLLGFPLVPSNHFSWGFDGEASLPTTRVFLSVLRQLDNAALQFLLDSSVS